MRGAGCRVQGVGCRVQGARFRVQGAGFREQGAGCRVQGTSGIRASRSERSVPARPASATARDRVVSSDLGRSVKIVGTSKYS